MKLRDRWQQSRLRFFRARIRHLMERQQWQRALTTVIDFAQWAQGQVDDVQVWLDMTIAATRIVGHLDDPAEYRAFLTHFADPFLGDHRHPRHELLDAFSSIADHVEPSVMISVGRWLTDARPRWPLGPYLIAHFREVQFRGSHNPEATRETTAFFRIAADRAVELDQKQWSLHCRLRQGALLLSSGTDRARGRLILGGLDWTGLCPTEQLWMAVALASSGQWTDRLRAMDIVLDLHRATSAARPGTSDLRLQDLQRTAAAIFRLAGIHLPEPESRRLEELTTTLFRGDERQRWLAYLDARETLSRIAALPFDDAEAAFATLDELSRVYPQRWNRVAHRFRILHTGWTGDYESSSGVPSPSHRDARLPLTDAVARTLSFLRNVDSESDDEALRTHLERLCELLQDATTEADGAALRPLAILWPRLLNRLDHFDGDALRDLLTEIARHYAAYAPDPGYGWWPLAAHLYRAELPDAADVIAERARGDERTFDDDETRSFVARTRFQRALDATDPVDARRWLDELS